MSGINKKYFIFAEEVLNTNNAIFMSADGHLMLYGAFNDTLVQEQHFAWYGTTTAGTPNSILYPEIRSLR